MVAFIDRHRDQYGVEAICALLPMAPSSYYEYKARQIDASRLPARTHRERQLEGEIHRVWQNFQVYGVRKMWRQLNREAIAVARCTVARLMARMGLRGVGARAAVQDHGCRGSACAAKTESSATSQSERPDALWVSDLTYVATWRGFVYVAFVIDAYARRIVGWRVSNMRRSDLALDALEQALYERAPREDQGLIHHSDRGSQYLSIRYTERLKQAGLEPSVGSVGDSYDNALAESIIGLYKTEVIRRRGPWRDIEAVEFATLEWVHWFNHRRLFEPIGHIPPAEREAAYYRAATESAMAA